MLEPQVAPVVDKVKSNLGTAFMVTVSKYEQPFEVVTPTKYVSALKLEKRYDELVVVALCDTPLV